MADNKKKKINSSNKTKSTDNIKKTQNKKSSKKVTSTKNDEKKLENVCLVNEDIVGIENDNIQLQKKKIETNYFSIKEVISVVIITAIVGFFMGFVINKNGSTEELSHYEKELLSNYQYILDNYYKDIDARDLVSVAIKGMISNLDDPYANYISLNQINDFNITVNGSYDGIGIQITYNDDGEPKIVTVFENSPAANSGLQKDDILLNVDSTSLSGKTLEEIQEIISDLNDSNFEITYRRNGEELKTTLKRDKIVIQSVNTKIHEINNKTIGYIKLDTFASNSYDQFAKKLSDLENNNIDSLIIDLRNNTGGQLTVVENIISMFVDKSNVIYQMKEKKQITKHYSKTNDKREYKIVILVNEFSASASELMAGTLKEIYGAIIVGNKTYGKGTAQEIISLENGEQYKFTTKEWLTAGGNSIEGVGVEPNIKVEQSEQYYENPIEENDTQLKEALKILSE